MKKSNSNLNTSKHRSLVLEFQSEDCALALSHFRSNLAFGTDPADVYTDLQNGVTDFVLIDARSPENYARGHVPGAISFPHRQMNETTAATLPKDKVIVVYCDGTGCNASTKGAARLAALGYRVKEMIGGLDWWRRDGYAVEVTAQNEGASSPVGINVAVPTCGCE